VGLLVVVYGAEQLARSENVPEGFWKAGQIGRPIFVATAVAATAFSFIMATSYARTLKHAEQDARLGAVCRDVARVVVKHTSLSHEVLGVHVWTVAGPPLARYLRRRTTFRPLGRQKLAITWRKGKGAIGRCWTTERAAVVDIDALMRLAPDEEHFCKLPSPQRLGMTWDELQKAKHYRAIWTVPLMAGPEAGKRFRGCLSVDVQARGKADELKAAIAAHEDELNPVLDTCEAALA